MHFKEWLKLDEGFLGMNFYHREYLKKFEKIIDMVNFSVIPPEERDPGGEIWKPPFDPKAASEFPPLEKECPITPLSGYAKHIKAIQSFAMSSPENFAQTMMFSPLSANVPFPKHWDNFSVIMAILRNIYPNKVTADELREVIKVFDDQYHSLSHTVSSWKFDTIAEIWSNKEKYFKELPKLAAENDDESLIARLSALPGVQPVKAGFMAQLLFGRAGCIDTHNIDIYSKVFPDMDFNPSKWDIKGNKFAQLEKGMPKEVEKYVSTLQKLSDRGFGTRQLWDVWVDFVENFYKYMTEHGLGLYRPMGAAIDKKDPLYKWLAQQGPIEKYPSAGRKTTQGVISGKFDVPLVGGGGMGASATHLQLPPEEMYRQLYRMYRLGKPGGEAASSIPFYRINRSGKYEPLEVPIGMGMEPSLLHYFAKKGYSELDPDYVKHVVRQRLSHKGRKGKEKSELQQKEEERMRKMFSGGFLPSISRQMS